MNRIRAGAALVVALGTLAAGCGSSGSTGSSGTTGRSTAASGGGGGGGIHVAHTSLGNVLVDGSGRTLYLLTADRKGHSTCSGACLATWPPTAPNPTGAPSTVTASLGRTTTPDGTPIATADGMPLYTYAGDSAAGDVNGEDIHSFGGVWYALSPAGHEIRKGSSGSSGSSGTGSGGGAGGGYGSGY